MSPADRLRKIALGRSHVWAKGLLFWISVDQKEGMLFLHWFANYVRWPHQKITRTDRRMFLLFVAEMLEGTP